MDSVVKSLAPVTILMKDRHWRVWLPVNETAFGVPVGLVKRLLCDSDVYANEWQLQEVNEVTGERWTVIGPRDHPAQLVMLEAVWRHVLQPRLSVSEKIHAVLETQLDRAARRTRHDTEALIRALWDVFVFDLELKSS